MLAESDACSPSNVHIFSSPNSLHALYSPLFYLNFSLIVANINIIIITYCISFIIIYCLQAESKIKGYTWNND